MSREVTGGCPAYVGFVAAFVVAFGGALLTGCAAPKLTDMQEVSDELGLTDGQIRAVRPDVQRIAAAVEDYEADKEAFVDAMTGQRPAGGRRKRGEDRDARQGERQDDLHRLNAKRVAYQEVIDRAVDAIAVMLDETQRERWAGIQKPTHTPPEVPQRGARRGRGGAGVPGDLGGDRGGGGVGGGFGGRR